MVKAYFDFDAEKNAFEMRVQGHADFAELGKDPVCAGASVLAFTAAQVIDIIDRNQLLEESVIRISGGNVRLGAGRMRRASAGCRRSSCSPRSACSFWKLRIRDTSR